MKFICSLLFLAAASSAAAADYTPVPKHDPRQAQMVQLRNGSWVSSFGCVTSEPGGLVACGAGAGGSEGGGGSGGGCH
jgi:hypothetical protein